jgi:DDE superfamily endonuclease
MPTLADLGYENAGDGFRHPHKWPARGELTEEQHTYNKVIRSIHGVCERTNSLLETTFKALRRVSLDPSPITKVAPQPSSCSSSSTTAPSERSHNAMIRYWQRLTVSGPSHLRVTSMRTVRRNRPGTRTHRALMREGLSCNPSGRCRWCPVSRHE